MVTVLQFPCLDHFNKYGWEKKWLWDDTLTLFVFQILKLIAKWLSGVEQEPCFSSNELKELGGQCANFK